MKNTELAARLEAACPEVDAAAGQYAAAAAAGTLSAAGPFVLSDIDNAEMSKHYDARFAAARSAGRAVYDQLRAFAAGRCPFCGNRPVKTLDHYWPKNGHGAVALVPDNLVPACRDCNTAKGSYQPTARSGELLHPYFDPEHHDQWLKARIVRALEGPVVIYYADPSPTWTAAEAARVTEHFTRLELGDHYSILAVDQISSMVGDLHDLLTAGSAADVVAHLASRFDREGRRSMNGWRTALYGGLAQDGWFCAGGFNTF